MRFRQTIRRAWLLTAYYTAITIFGIGTLTYNLLTALLSLLGPLAPSSATLRKSNTILVRLFFWLVRTLGLSRIRIDPRAREATAQPALIIANHTGLIDAPVINTFIPEMVCVFKNRLLLNPCFSHILRHSGHLSNADGIDMIRKGIDVLRKGQPLLLFPEGTRGEHSESFSFKPGFAIVAKRAAVPVVLLAIENPHYILTKHRPFLYAPELPFHYNFRYVATLDVAPEDEVPDIVAKAESMFTHFFHERRHPIASQS